MNKEKQKENIRELKKAFPKGSTAYTKLIDCSKSGMTRIIGVIAIKKNEPNYYSYKVGELLEYKHAEKFGEYGLKVGGCGMDMGFHLIYQLSSKLYKDGYAIKQRWI
jgi:hypothetical protein